MEKLNIFWFRRDLRIADNHGLFCALNSSENVLPIFIFDAEILANLPKNDARVTFIHQQLSQLNNFLKTQNKGIRVCVGKPFDVFAQLCSEFRIESVFSNRDYEPYAQKRDREIAGFLNKNGIRFQQYKDQVIFEQNEVVKEDGNPYVVYTPFMRKWKSVFAKTPPCQYPSEAYLHKLWWQKTYSIPTLQEIGFEASSIHAPQYQMDAPTLTNYEATRNFPALDGTSFLGTYLRFGTVSVRQIVQSAWQIENQTFLNELIWREFFMQILWHFPHTVTRSFKSQYDAILWRNSEADFDKWKHGQTGFPLVDAGMRQLNQTGWMHNRVRMLVGSFLCKHLLIDWRWGEAYFAEKLLDYEMSSNVGNWQWVAGCGVDAAPYFRIFNPAEQVKKFDAKHLYIKKWVDELDSFAYPQPMVDHKEARERCLRVYKTALGS
ncbi:MAG: DNA photolyase family protein [Bacteroidetes bacterium]|nr:DNA photolyase family protein [Bacteroidota bacterium]